MSLQAAIEATLPRLRAQALARMTSRATIRRRALDEDGIPLSTWDEETGRNTPVWETVDSGVPCRVDDIDPVTISTPGGDDVIANAGLHFDATYRLLRDEDRVDVTSGEWPGRVYRLPLIPGADQKTALRVKGVQEQRPEEWG